MLLSVSDLHKSYAGPDGHLPVLRGIKMLLARGETLALTGESGSGKSTLLHIIGGLDQPDSGIVAVDGVDIGAMDDAGRAGMRRDKVSLVFQQFNLPIALLCRAQGQYLHSSEPLLESPPWIGNGNICGMVVPAR